MTAKSDRLFKVASAQQGYFTTAQALACGYPRPHHNYHVRVGTWQRERRGIYRLTRFPASEEGQYVLWSLWSRNLKGETQGVYSHQTALSLSDLSDVMPSRLHMTVPPDFRRRAPIPSVLVLHRGSIEPRDVASRQGYRVVRPLRAIADLLREGAADLAQLRLALQQALDRGLIARNELRRHPDRRDLQTLLTSRRL